MAYTIEQNIIPNLPKINFRNGSYEGVVNHCTDSPNHSGGDMPTNERNYEANTFENAFVHYFVGVENGQVKIMQVAPIEFIAWGAGHTANQRYLHIELCMYDDPNLFKMAYDAFVWLTAKLLFDKRLGVTECLTLWSHKQISDTFKETDHTDPVDYLASHGISWEQHVKNVIAMYYALANEAVCLVSTPGTFRIRVICPQLYYYDKPDWHAIKGVVKEGEIFTVVKTLWIDGSKMYQLKSGNYITANPSFVGLV